GLREPPRSRRSPAGGADGDRPSPLALPHPPRSAQACDGAAGDLVPHMGDRPPGPVPDGPTEHAGAREPSRRRRRRARPAPADPLREGLPATGPRLSLSLTLHVARRRVTEPPVSWSRLWVTGRRGMYRMDRPSTPALEVRPVGGGDVLGTLLPILEQGLRFAA